MSKLIHEKKYNNELHLAFVEFKKDIGTSAYFSDRESANEGIFLQIQFSFPDQKLNGHDIFLQLEHLDIFLDETEMERECIDNKGYNRFECYFCMDGPEKTLYTHEGAGELHMHKSCYNDLSEAIKDFLEESREKITAFQI